MSRRPTPPPGFTLDGDDDELPPPPAGFQLDTAPAPQQRPALPTPSGTITGPVDGDTFNMSSGGRVRLPIVDAPELRQQGWDRQGLPVPIGKQSLNASAAAIAAGQARLGTPVGESYGRTVAPVTVDGQDLGLNLTRDGNVILDRRYLPKDPRQRYDYLQSERLARQNRLAVHGTFHQTPAEFRADPTYQPSRETVAQFWDTPTPQAGLSADIEKGYLDISRTGTPEQMIAYAEANGFKIDPESTRKFVEVRDGGSNINWVVNYGQAPKPLTDPGDGRVGSGARGASNGVLFNQLEELGAGVDTLGLTGGRENIWNSDRRLADIYVNNLDQNEAITGYDRAYHPYVYGGAELAGAFAVPMSSVRSASGLAKWGAAYGGLTGLGQEGSIPERLTSGVIGSGLGAATTILGTRALDAAAPLVSKGFNRVFGREGGRLPEPDIAPWESVPPPPDGFTPDPPSVRQRDVIDIGPGTPLAPEASPGIDTAYAGPTMGQPRSLDDITADVQQWAKDQGVGGGTMLHGSRRNDIEQFDPYQFGDYGLFGQGTYLTDNPRVALGYTGKGSRGEIDGRTLYSVQQSVSNPLDLDGPIDIGRWGKLADQYGLDLHQDMRNADAYRALEDAVAEERIPKWEGSEIMSDAVRSLGHDGLTHIGGGRFGQGEGPRHRVVIALDPEQTNIAGQLDVGAMMRPQPRDRSWIDINASGSATRQPNRIDVGPASPRPIDPRQPVDTAYPGPLPSGRERDWLDIGSVPPPPNGFTLDMPGGRPWVDVGMPANDLPRSIAMDGSALPSLSQDMPGRVPDYLFPPQPQRLTDPLSDARMGTIANDIEPRDVLPIASNEVGSIEEAAGIDAGRYAPARPVDEATALGSRTVMSQNGQPLSKRGPLDMVTWLRSQGGVRDQGGDLRAMGIDNKPRDLDFARGEQRFGKLINNEGMSLDDAAFKAWEAGYMPGLERPDVNAFLDALDRTHTGTERFYHPDDLPEVAQFEGMRIDRQMLEQRLADGPMHVDRSVPAGDDAPFPPPEAYEEWPAGGPDFAGNIRLENLNAPQDIKRALTTVNNRFGFDAATRGRVANAETERLAGDLGMTPEQLMTRRRGQAFNAEEALAARQILAKSGNELVNLAKRVQSIETPGDDILAQFSQALRRHAAIQEQVSGMTAEAGRTLQQFRMLADARKVPGEVLGRLVDMNGGRGRLEDAAQTILDTIESEPGKFNPLIEKLSKPRWIDKAIELRYNMLLSGPQTHAANIISNTLTSLGQFPEHAAAAAIGMGRRAFRGSQRAADRVYPSELASRGFGLLAGTKEGLAQFARTLRTGETSDLVTKVETQADEVISGIKGKIIRTPSRLLSAEDELFKAMARKMELYGLADRQASSELLRGQAKADRIAGLVADPPDHMLAKTFDYARYLTYQRPLNGIPLSASAMTNKHPTLKFIVPFVRTPTNLMKYAAERSPAAPLIKEWRADMVAGGARRDLAIAKAVVGTGVALWMADLAAQGGITGSPPDDPNKERLLRADGWQPNSIKVGDRYISYNRLDPFAMSIGAAADLATKQDGMTSRQLENASGLLVASLVHSMSDRTWLSGLSDLFSMLDDPQRNLPNYLQSQGASLVIPTGLSQIARDVDPTRRHTDSVTEEVQSRVPGASSSLPPQRDIWGRPIEIDRLGPEAVSPITQTQRRNDPVAAEMLRLGSTATAFPRGRRVDGKWVEYTPAQYDQLQAKAGSQAHEMLSGLVQTPQWKQLSPESQAKAIKDTITAARTSAKAEVLGGDPQRSGRLQAAAKILSAPPPPPGFKVDGEAGGVNVYADLQKAIPGIRFTSGFRTREYQEEMRRRGYRPAQNSQHLDGRSLDMLPPPGRSMEWLKGQVRQRHPDANLSIHDGHLHATFPGYYGAPVLGGAKAAGLRNPNIGMPAPPPGFKLD